MRSKITAIKAQALVQKFEQDYIRICTKIVLAAKAGERETTINDISSHETRQQLEDDGFELTANSDKTHRIWWGQC